MDQIESSPKPHTHTPTYYTLGTELWPYWGLSSNRNSITMDNSNICLMGESKPNLITALLFNTSRKKQYTHVYVSYTQTHRHTSSHMICLKDSLTMSSINDDQLNSYICNWSTLFSPIINTKLIYLWSVDSDKMNQKKRNNRDEDWQVVQFEKV